MDLKQIAKGIILGTGLAVATLGCGNKDYQLLGSKELEDNKSVDLYRKTENVIGVKEPLVTDSLVIRNKDGSTIAFLDILGKGTIGTGHFNYVINKDGVKYPRGLLASALEDSLDKEYRSYRSEFE